MGEILRLWVIFHCLRVWCLSFLTFSLLKRQCLCRIWEEKSRNASQIVESPCFFLEIVHFFHFMLFFLKYIWNNFWLMRIPAVQDIFDELSHILARFVSRRMSSSMFCSKFLDNTSKNEIPWGNCWNLRVTLSALIGIGCRYYEYIY